MQNNIQQNVITLFENNGYARNQQVYWQIIKTIFNQRSEKVLKIPFKQQILQDLLEECRTNKQKLTPYNIGEVVYEAHGILRKRINSLEGDNGLIHTHKVALEEKKQQLRNPNIHDIYLHKQMLQLSQDIAKMQQQTAKLQQSLKLFYTQYSMLDKLFNIQLLRNNSFGMSRQQAEIINDKVINPDHLTAMFYFGVFGALVEVGALGFRPGFTGLAIYGQALFVLLVGYYHRKAVMLLSFTNLLTILMDALMIGFYFYSYPLDKILKLNQPIDTIQKIASLIYKVMLIISIIIRIIIFILGLSLVQPPITRVYYKICDQKILLNTRLSQSAKLAT